jgi:hypothetical protein
MAIKSKEHTMTDPYNEIWEIYTASWKVTTAEEKLALFNQSLVSKCTYTDPTVQTQGWDELAAYMLEFHKQIAGGHFVTNYFLAHHNCSISKWEMRNADNIVLGDGISYGQYDKNNRLLTMTGFFETP